MQSDLNLQNDSTEFEEDIVDLDEDDSEISGDCNESQPCRDDEAWLPQDLDDNLLLAELIEQSRP
ncbi:hypothetical protein [Tunturiibacter gelidoferens]|uniref:Uncharacterized protein n=1 Tax=Tunturiibacter lichenicola TaxID=2051959 RepID=A0A7Y9NRI3_9BACT|nr:hypothetical protein [Edaphobacter lichenicola]NYF53570.1 hypothetical protein [Edaphobacter lichenicola]